MLSLFQVNIDASVNLLFPGAGIADSLDDGMFVRLKKSDEVEPDYSISNKRPNSKRARKGRKLSVVGIILEVVRNHHRMGKVILKLIRLC